VNFCFHTPWKSCFHHYLNHPQYKSEKKKDTKRLLDFTLDMEKKKKKGLSLEKSPKAADGHRKELYIS
jgi:hypothetical protein